MDNLLYKYIEEFFSEMAIINGHFVEFNSRIMKHTQNLQKIYTDNSIDINTLFSGSMIPFCDLTEPNDDGWLKYYPSDLFSIKGATYIAFADKLIQRNAALSAALSYEAFERFLISITANFLMEYTSIEIKEKVEAFAQKKNMNLNVDLCRKYIEKQYKVGESKCNNRYLFDFIREQSCDYAQFEHKNSRSIVLSDWYEALSEARHAIIHSNFIVKRINKITDPQKALLFETMHGETVQSGYKIQMNADDIDKIFRLTIEMGFLVYKCLSIKANCEWNIGLFKMQ
jgi:hypothetical protein